MKVRRRYFKIGSTLLIASGAFCTCAALDIGVDDIVRTFLRAVGMQDLQHRDRFAKAIFVGAGNELTVGGGNATVTPLAPDAVAKRLAWAGISLEDGWLSFRGETLETVIAEFNLHNRVQLVIKDPETGRLRVGGKFRVTDVHGFVAALGVTHGVKVTHSDPVGRGGDVIVLTRGSSESEGSAEIPDLPDEPQR